jgi:hypothetical protein
MKVHLSQSMIFTAKKGVGIRAYINNLLADSDTVITVNETSKTPGATAKISVEHIRDMIEQTRTATRGHRTIIIFDDAATMTEAAQNALLKTLEEPRDNLFILLATHTISKLLPTVLSRCQVHVVSSGLNNNVSMPDNLKAQILFMSGGIRDEMIKLSADEEYLKSMQYTFEQAKRYIGMQHYAKLVFISKIEKWPRDEVLHFLGAVLRMLEVILQRQYSAKTLVQLRRIVAADEAIRMNGNIRMQLLKSVV